jgi:hypothetical protein
LTVYQSDASAEGNAPSICWVGTNAANVVSVLRGSVGIAYFEGEEATVATLSQSYIDSVDSDAAVQVGDGVTLGDFVKVGGTALVDCGADSVVNSGGVLTLRGEGDVAYLATRQEATTYSETTGTLGTYGTVTGATKADPCVITSTAHGLSTGDRIRIASVGGMVELNDADYTVEVVDANSFSLVGIDSSAFTTWTSGGTWAKLETVEVTGKGTLDFSRSLVSRSAACPIVLVGEDAAALDTHEALGTSTYPGFWVLDARGASVNGVITHQHWYRDNAK